MLNSMRPTSLVEPFFHDDFIHCMFRRCVSIALHSIVYHCSVQTLSCPSLHVVIHFLSMPHIVHPSPISPELVSPSTVLFNPNIPALEPTPPSDPCPLHPMSIYKNPPPPPDPASFVIRATYVLDTVFQAPMYFSIQAV